MNREHVVGLVCVAISIVTWILAADLPQGKAAISVSGPGLFPNVLATVLALCGLSEFILGTVKRRELPAIRLPEAFRRFATKECRSILAVLFLVAGFILFFPHLGFFLTTFLFLFLCMKLFGVHWNHNLVASVSVVVVIYLVFGVLFTISLPSGILRYVGL